MFGPRVLGKEGARLEALKQNNGMGGGAIGFGPRVLGAKAATPYIPPAMTELVTPAAVPAVKRKPATASRNRIAPAARAKPAVKGAVAETVAYSEAEVETMLGEDPNVWPRIMTAEGRRKQVRFAVARMVLDVRDTATDPALPTKVIAELERVLAPRVAAPRVATAPASPRAAARSAGLVGATG
jgi:hypothetical protein